ncbi:FCD domain-containing protein [Streptomyces sp. V4-01]|uniref:FCD domain-containing protein n=1 Tax=Actinacidiphila polyblastidii TaxID=3110430 RepID=A0ABU7PHQ5_9ACTN|nr:FCD domain-containing protein [Streptomyces sp. V4-01]
MSAARDDSHSLSTARQRQDGRTPADGRPAAGAPGGSLTAGPLPAGSPSGRGAGGAGTRAEAAARRLIDLAEATGPGVRLGTKEELRVRCGVSVGTFNESLRMLQARGVITVRPGPGGGLFSAEQSPMVRLGNSVLALDSQQTDVAEAVRIRDALDPLLIEDALWHASPADIAGLREQLHAMALAVSAEDPVAFVHANWRLHARIAAISPNALLRSLYSNLLDLIEAHTLAVQPFGEEPLREYIAARHQLHSDLVDALDRRDRDEALRLIHDHNTSPSSQEPAADPAG